MSDRSSKKKVATALCPGCKRQIRLRRDGTFYWHAKGQVTCDYSLDKKP